jgi:Na+/proline symporter/signal transduction histidine kinase
MVNVVIVTVCAYMALLFAIARVSERRRASGRGFTQNPYVYALSLGVFCTTWTFYGSIGKATVDGMLFLPVYLGPTLGMFFAPTIMSRLIRLKEAHHITSLADFISARYAKSRLVAALVTAILLVGTIPYAALQLKSMGDTFALVVGGAGATPAGIRWVTPLVVCTMVAFTIAFGIRRLDPTERHPGMVVSLAAESLTKLVAFLCGGIFVTRWAFGGGEGFFVRLSAGLPENLGFMHRLSADQALTWATYMLLSTAAFSFLPRQFHVGIVENSNVKHTRTAMWLTPLYLFAMNLFVVPVAVAAMDRLPKNISADTALLSFPLLAGQHGLSLLVFLGGFSAAVGMIMVETMTMATMVSNHLYLPVVDSSPKLWFLRRHLLGARWAIATLFIFAALGFAVAIGKSYMLVSIGMLSFAAVLQLAPVSLLGLYWKGASRKGVMLGLSAGFVLWSYTLLMPTFVKSGWMSDAILKVGPFGIAALRPTALFGLEGLPALTHGVMWTTLFNVTLYVAGSVFFPPTSAERRLAEEFGNIDKREGPLDGAGAAGGPTMSASTHLERLERMLAQYFPATAARALMHRCLETAGIADAERVTVLQWTELTTAVERSLAGAIGAASAHTAVRELRVDGGTSKALENAYARMLVRMQISPAELRRRVDYHQERETLLQEQAGELEARVKERTIELTRVNETLRGEIGERKKAQATVVEMSEQLANAAHRAGKAEIATNVLHNVGNVLNSIMVSVRLTIDRLRQSRVDNVRRAAELLAAQDEVLAAQDEGSSIRRLPGYLAKLATHLSNERDEMLAELDGVFGNAEHIKHVIGVQQEFAGTSNFVQATDVPGLVADAVRITSLENEGVEIVRDLPALPLLMLNKHKVLQVLINLVGNAKNAIIEADGDGPKRVTLRVAMPSDDCVSIAVIDTGKGISSDDLQRVFQHGFTTRKNGHGFGLHGSVNAATEMGGRLSAHSDGPGRGATFTLEIPCTRAAAVA